LCFSISEYRLHFWVRPVTKLVQFAEVHAMLEASKKESSKPTGSDASAVSKTGKKKSKTTGTDRSSNMSMPNKNPNPSCSKKLTKSTRTVNAPSTSTNSMKNRTDRESLKATPDNEYNEELLNKMSKALTYNTWFHGLMPRDEIEELLTKDGDFLVRKTEVSKHIRYAVTLMFKGRIRHILLTYKNDMWSLRDLKKPTVTELIETHMSEKIPVMSDGALLTNAVPRPPFYILHEHIQLKSRLGSGAFGEVFLASYTKGKDDSIIPVAVKQLKGIMFKKQRAEFVKEAKLMRRFDHPNIVKVYGIAPQEEPILIILELAANGTLKSKLREKSDIAQNTLIRYATDACRGLCYLAGCKVIHRDIAARNCLLGKKDEVKISDFGMSVADKSLLKLDKLKNMPVKWLSPEVIRKGEFTTKSDVWAFGVLVWEIFARCRTDPFPGLTNQQAKDKILAGQKPVSDTAPEMIKNIMMLCFTQDPEQRPDFEGVFKLLAPKETPPPKMPDFETYT